MESSSESEEEGWLPDREESSEEEEEEVDDEVSTGWDRLCFAGWLGSNCGGGDAVGYGLHIASSGGSGVL